MGASLVEDFAVVAVGRRRAVLSWVDRRSSAGLAEAKSTADVPEERRDRRKMDCSPSHAMAGFEVDRCLVCIRRQSSEAGRIGMSAASEGHSGIEVLLEGLRKGCMWVAACRMKIEAAKAEGDGQTRGSWVNLTAA